MGPIILGGPIPSGATGRGPYPPNASFAAGCRSAPDSPLAAVTGATGFIGRHLVAELHRAGWRVRLLLRREPDVAEWRDLPPPQVVAGALDDDAALERLVEGADVVIHLAGLIKAARRRDFLAVNRDGAAAMARAVERVAPGARFLLVSSLAAREPQLSDYAASKRAGEGAVLERPRRSARPCCVRRSVYGPGDRETLVFFQLAGEALVPLLGSAEVARGDDPRRRPGAPDRRDGARARRAAPRCARPPTIGRRATPGRSCSARRRARSAIRRRASCARRRRC